NFLRQGGPGAILLAAAIGSGEWLLTPAAVIHTGTGVLLIVSVAVLLQLILNLEVIRYTLYTGEPILTGFMRTWPGPAWWSVVYTLFGLLQLGWPGLAASCAAV
ncbi:MAG: hypothetical protein GWN58_16065, partial [Anaerolineae bacterium]|nr:hypothetical protein [Anaerolineae bacterium]